MELEWEQERQSAHTSAALAGAFLGAALGADCFLAINHLAGEIPACLFCGAAMAFWAVRGGALFAGRDSRSGTLLSLLPIILWGSLVNHLSFALAAAPGDPSGVRDALLSLELTGRYWLRLGGLFGMVLCVWGLLYVRPARGWELEKRAAQPCRNPPQPQGGGAAVRRADPVPGRLQRRGQQRLPRHGLL